MKDLDKIKRILEIKANYQKLETCVVCGAKTESVYFHNDGDPVGSMLCKTCNELQITEDDVKGDYQLEYLRQRAHKK